MLEVSDFLPGKALQDFFLSKLIFEPISLTPTPISLLRKSLISTKKKLHLICKTYMEYFLGGASRSLITFDQAVAPAYGPLWSFSLSQFLGLDMFYDGAAGPMPFVSSYTTSCAHRRYSFLTYHR